MTSRILYALALLSIVTFVVAARFLAGYLSNDQDLVLIRNALVAEFPQSMALFEAPGDGRWAGPDTASASGFDSAIAAISRDGAAEDELDLALGIVRHLDYAGTPDGPMIRSNTAEAYRRIREDGSGYCADFTQVFLALAATAGIAAREWGISFRGYSGDGHAFVEIYSTRRGKWVLIDPYVGVYFTGGDNVPLSFLELRSHIALGTTERVSVNVLVDALPFKSHRAVIHYYARGASRAYAWMPSGTPGDWQREIVRVAAGFSRTAEQLTEILLGVHPGMNIVPNAAERAAVLELRLVGLSVFLCVLSPLGGIRDRRRRHGAPPEAQSRLADTLRDRRNLGSRDSSSLAGKWGHSAFPPRYR